MREMNLTCPSGHSVSPESRFCGICGIPLISKRSCSNGHQMEANDEYCQTCGARSNQFGNNADVKLEDKSSALPPSDLELKVAEVLAARLAALDEAKRNKWLGDAYRELPSELKNSGESHPKLIAAHYVLSAGFLAALPALRLGQLSTLRFQALNVQPRNLDWSVDCLDCKQIHGVLWFENSIYSSLDGHKISKINCPICHKSAEVDVIKKNTHLKCRSNRAVAYKTGLALDVLWLHEKRNG